MKEREKKISKGGIKEKEKRQKKRNLEWRDEVNGKKWFGNRCGRWKKRMKIKKKPRKEMRKKRKPEWSSNPALHFFFYNIQVFL